MWLPGRFIKDSCDVWCRVRMRAKKAMFRERHGVSNITLYEPDTARQPQSLRCHAVHQWRRYTEALRKLMPSCPENERLPKLSITGAAFRVVKRDVLIVLRRKIIAKDESLPLVDCRNSLKMEALIRRLAEL